MPGGDRTGPLGMGPMTGRAAGYCAGYNVPGYMNPYGGRGMGYGRMMGGRGRGGGFGRGRGFGRFAAPYVQPPVYPVPQPQPGFDAMPYDESAEIEMLRAQAQSIEATLSGIQKRIEALEAQKAEKPEGSKDK